LATAIGLEVIPHFTTFQKAAKRLLLTSRAQRLLDETVGIAVKGKVVRRKVDLAAVDGTGFESRHASSYYVKRRAKGGNSLQKTTYQRYPKAGILSDCRSHMILAVVPGTGPKQPDSLHFKPALDQGLRRVPIRTLAADAGYDSEGAHRYAREERGVCLLMPARKGRPTDKLPTGYWRRQMAIRLHNTRYGQRWQSETVNSMWKRLVGSAMRARSYWARYRETFLRALTLNTMIL
jgi:hypothetical protein